MKDNTPHNKKKKNSPSKEHFVGKWEKKVMGIKTSTTREKFGPKARENITVGSSKHSRSSTLKEELKYLP